MNSLKVYKNSCKEDIVSGIQLEREQCEYNLGYQLQATTHKGLRSNQEDEVLILEHPENKEIKLIAVADGVGGTQGSERASNYLLKCIIKAFELIISKDYDDMEFIQVIFEKSLKNINQKIITKKLGETTLSMAIVTKKGTIIINAGDSRIYTYTDGKIKQRTTDDSVVEELYQNRVIPEKDLMRFHKQSNIILNCFGNKKIKINSKTIPNDYETILGFSDGVTDCVSEKELESIINENNESDITSAIVSYALYNDSMIKSKYIGKPNYYEVIKGGKDNTSAVAYQRKM